MEKPRRRLRCCDSHRKQPSPRGNTERSWKQLELSEIQLLAVVAQHSAFRVGSQPHSSVVTEVIC